jgi:hypothetical protein
MEARHDDNDGDALHADDFLHARMVDAYFDV